MSDDPDGAEAAVGAELRHPALRVLRVIAEADLDLARDDARTLADPALVIPQRGDAAVAQGRREIRVDVRTQTGARRIAVAVDRTRGRDDEDDRRLRHARKRQRAVHLLATGQLEGDVVAEGAELGRRCRGVVRSRERAERQRDRGGHGAEREGREAASTHAAPRTPSSAHLPRGRDGANENARR